MNLQVLFEKLAEKLGLKPQDDRDEWLQNEVWQNFMLEKIPQIKDRHDLYSIQLRKMFIGYYHDKFNTNLVHYFRDLKLKSKNLQNLGSSDEPAKISSQVFALSQIFHKEILVDLNLNFSRVTSKFSSNIDQLINLLERASKPELLTKSKKFSQMEMEMDKFLAKKSAIFNKIIFQNQYVDLGSGAGNDPRLEGP